MPSDHQFQTYINDLNFVETGFEINMSIPSRVALDNILNIFKSDRFENLLEGENRGQDRIDYRYWQIATEIMGMKPLTPRKIVPNQTHFTS